MTGKQIKLIRDLYHQDDGTGKPLAFSTTAVFNNEIAFVDTDHFVIWDDANELVHCIFPNTDSPVSSTLSPYRISTGFFDNIQYIEGLIGMDNFESVIDKLFVETNLINEEKKKDILQWAFTIRNVIPTPDQVPYFKETPIIVPSVPQNPPVRKDGIYPSVGIGSVTMQDQVDNILHDIITSKATKTKMTRVGITNKYRCDAKNYTDLRDDIYAIIQETVKQDGFRFASIKCPWVNVSYDSLNHEHNIKYIHDAIFNTSLDNANIDSKAIELELRINAYLAHIDITVNGYPTVNEEFKSTTKTLNTAIETSNAVIVAGTKENPTYVFDNKDTMAKVFADEITKFKPDYAIINNEHVDCSYLNIPTVNKAMKKAEIISEDMDNTSTTESQSDNKLLNKILSVIDIKNRSIMDLEITLIKDKKQFKLPTYNIKYYNKDEDSILPEIIVSKDARTMKLNKDLINATIKVNAGEKLIVDFMPGFIYENLTIINNGELILTSTNHRSDNIHLKTSIVNNKNAYLQIDDGYFYVETGHAIENHGKLLIKTNNNPSIAVAEHKKAVIHNCTDGSADLFGGRYFRIFEAGASLKDSGGNSFYYIYNEGNMKLYGVNIYSSGKYSSLICNKGTMHILDCTLENGHIVVKNENQITIGGNCEFNSSMGSDVVQNWGTADITELNCPNGKMSTYSIKEVKINNHYGNTSLKNCNFSICQVISWDKITKPTLIALNTNVRGYLKIDAIESFVKFYDSFIYHADIIEYENAPKASLINELGFFYNNTKFYISHEDAINLDTFVEPLVEDKTDPVVPDTTETTVTDGDSIENSGENGNSTGGGDSMNSSSGNSIFNPLT